MPNLLKIAMGVMIAAFLGLDALAQEKIAAVRQVRRENLGQVRTPSG